MNRALALSMFLAILLPSSVWSKEEIMHNLLESETVTYTYINGDGKDIGNKANNDLSGNYLKDGQKGNNKAVVKTSNWKNLFKKKISVRFDFRQPVVMNKVVVWWQWGHNEKMWIHRFKILAGNSPETLKLVKVYDKHKRLRKSTVPITIDLPTTKAKYLQIEMEQDATKEHWMFGISEIEIFGPKSNYESLKNSTQAVLKLEIPRNFPCNIFAVNTPVKFAVKAKFNKRLDGGNGKLTIKVFNYFNELVEDEQVNFSMGSRESIIPLQFNNLDKGYYVLKLEATVKNQEHKSFAAKAQASFGVSSRVNRSAEQALKDGNRFGMHWGYWSHEGNEACIALGLQWARALLYWGPDLKIIPGSENRDFSIMEKFLAERSVGKRINFVAELKTFPKDCYNEQVYGLIKKGRTYGPYQRKHWFDTIPKKAEYQKLVQEAVKRTPESTVFEIWNEPWGKFTAIDFSTIAQWTLEAVKRARPNAKVGPNLRGQYLATVLEAGGMNGMDMVTLHPYVSGFTGSPEKHSIREVVKREKALIRDKLAKDLPVYITEFGWPTPPKGIFKNTEEEQAIYIVRESMQLFAEDAKVIIPYCMGQPEKDAGDKEHYFGFIRANKEPKPALLAFAHLSQLLEGGTYVGDIWYGKDIGAMLFKRKDGRLLLALYSDGGKKHVLIKTGVAKLDIVDIMGRSRTTSTRDGKLSLTLTGTPVFLSGVSDKLLSKVIKSTLQSQWTNVHKRGQRIAWKNDGSISIDGNFNDWKNVDETIKIKNNKIGAEDISATLKVCWDKQNLYIFADVIDDEPGNNPNRKPRIWAGDCLELFIGTNLDSQVTGFLKSNDHQILVSPTSYSGKPHVIFADYNHKDKELICQKAFKINKDGWQVELAIPWASLTSFKYKKDIAIAFEAAIDDLDKKHPRMQLNSNNYGGNYEDATIWSELILKDKDN